VSAAQAASTEATVSPEMRIGVIVAIAGLRETCRLDAIRLSGDGPR
jgi:hypothetical protein